jgi:hypothetical protein
VTLYQVRGATFSVPDKEEAVQHGPLLNPQEAWMLQQSFMPSVSARVWRALDSKRLLSRVQGEAVEPEASGWRRVSWLLVGRAVGSIRHRSATRRGQSTDSWWRREIRVRNNREGDLEQVAEDNGLFVAEYTRAVSFISNHLPPGQVSVNPFPSESRSEDGGRERCTTALPLDNEVCVLS